MKNPDLQSIYDTGRTYVFLAQTNTCAYYIRSGKGTVVEVREGGDCFLLRVPGGDTIVIDRARPIVPPVYVPYTPETFEDVWFRAKRAPGTRVRVVEYNESGVIVSPHVFFTFPGLLENYEKLDGTPAGALTKP